MLAQGSDARLRKGTGQIAERVLGGDDRTQAIHVPMLAYSPMRTGHWACHAGPARLGPDDVGRTGSITRQPHVLPCRVLDGLAVLI